MIRELKNKLNKLGVSEATIKQFTPQFKVLLKMFGTLPTHLWRSDIGPTLELVWITGKAVVTVRIDERSF